MTAATEQRSTALLVRLGLPAPAGCPGGATQDLRQTKQRHEEVGEREQQGDCNAAVQKDQFAPRPSQQPSRL